MKKQIKENWEQEFDKEFGIYFEACIIKTKEKAIIDARIFKDFVRNLLQAQREQILGEIKKRLPKEKRYINFKTAEGEDGMWRKEGYNQALKEIKKELGI